MSYTPTEWKTGDVITADKLNNMEDGIVKAGRGFKVTITGSEDAGYAMDKTCAEIKSAIMNGSFVWAEVVETLDNETIYEQLLPSGFTFYEAGGCVIEVYNEEFTAHTDAGQPHAGGK